MRESSSNDQLSNPIWVNGSTTTPWPQLGGRRDYVNTNIPSPKWVRPTTKVTTSSTQRSVNKPQINSNTRRDYVNPNISNQPNNNPNIRGNARPTPKATPNYNAGTRLNPVGPSSNNNQNNEKSANKINNVEDNELREFSEALLKKDVNNAAKFITINFQSKTTSRSQVDEAPQPYVLRIYAKRFFDWFSLKIAVFTTGGFQYIDYIKIS